MRNFLIFAALLRGEQMLSCKEPGGLFAICELGNGTWNVPFPDRSADTTARDRGLPKARQKGC